MLGVFSDKWHTLRSVPDSTLPVFAEQGFVDSTSFLLRDLGRYREMARFPSNQGAGADGEQLCD